MVSTRDRRAKGGYNDGRCTSMPLKPRLSPGCIYSRRLHVGGNAIQPCEPLSFQQLEGCRVGVVEDGQIVHP